LAERLRAWRDRLLVSPGFRAWATRFPLTRPIARQRSRALFDLCAGFVYSQVLAACVRLEVFEALRDGPLPAAALALRLGLPRDSAERLLAAATSLRLLELRGRDAAGLPRWGLGPLGAAMLGDAGLAAMVRHHATLYADLADPVALLRKEAGPTALKRYWAYAGADQPEAVAGAAVADYSALMAATQPMVAAEVLAAYDLRRHRCLLDLGGGEGGFLMAAAQAAPGLRLMLLDLPAVAERARSRLAAAGLAGRSTVHGGSFLADSLPTGADCISLVRVIHDHDDAVAMTILRAARQALPPGGTLLLAEPMAAAAGAEPMGGAYFGFYLMAMGSGRPRRAEELAAMLIEAGFQAPRRHRTGLPLLCDVLTAQVKSD
jgi:demethylspheroidene O-methyltransferase